MQFQGMGTHPSVFSIKKKEFAFLSIVPAVAAAGSEPTTLVDHELSDQMLYQLLHELVLKIILF